MEFQVECFENVDVFTVRDAKVPFLANAYDPEQDMTSATNGFMYAPLRRVMNLRVEAERAEYAADVAFEIANAPWQPHDLDGVMWDHERIRSMSSGDVVLVHTPDGPVAYGCLFMGWLRLERLPHGSVAALA